MNAPDTRPEISKLSFGGVAAATGTSPQEYLNFLNRIISAGTRTPAAMPSILCGVADFTAGLKKWKDAAIAVLGANAQVPELLKLGSEGGVDELPISMEIDAAEKHLVKIVRSYQDDPAMCPDSGAKLKSATDDQLQFRLRELFLFVKPNQQLSQFIRTLLAPPAQA